MIRTRPSDIDHRQWDKQTETRPVRLLGIDYLRTISCNWASAVGDQQPGPALHIPAVIKPHITDVGPPLGSARDRDADRAVHEFKMAKASPSIARGLK